ncbi:ATP-binding cassette domain-containing protein [Herbaspirillum huttiense F1]|uniref:ATP-binding cassette domain-containing protein n=1 Tax=Herbaspirillum huttiense subsp. lycopersici TaxID=3074428 RepID=A0ABU2EU03_9BURK|nr:ATP-binding cassette domain-containing protein [Herbaspirillum huttiense]MDR9851283.1 ATP-binding cassette domain-containing protein [Herbaspirillum huttiense SE1]MDT0358196.1 ATP-binding cassette domain-containing protein [Herbaspirillum huttiense F1]
MTLPVPLLTFDNLVAGYADTPVLHRVSAKVSAGQALGVIGRNGVGKSTLLRALAGIIRPFSGSVSWSGQALEGQPAYAYRAMGMSYAPQERVVFDELSVADNLTLGQANRDLAIFANSFLLFPRLQSRLPQKAGVMSGGEKKLLSFVRIMSEEGALSLLDEPSEGVAPENIALMAQVIQQAKARGKAFLLAEQNIDFLLSVCDHLLIMDHGEFVASGPLAQFSRERIESYLAV